MNMHSIGNPGLLGPAYQSLMRSLEKATDTTSTSSQDSTTGSGATAGGAPGASPGAGGPGASLLSGANMIEAMHGGIEDLEVTGAVTATLPNGITLGIYSFAPVGADQGQADPSSGSSGASDGSSAAPGGGPDYAAMAAALEQMVDQFMNSASAYQQSASTSAPQNGATGTVA
jgi:hypothetical protein